MQPDYQHYRIISTAYLGQRIAEAGVPIVQPPGGHAIYIDAASFCPQVPRLEFPGIALTVELYREAGIRAVEILAVTGLRGVHDRFLAQDNRGAYPVDSGVLLLERRVLDPYPPATRS